MSSLPNDPQVEEWFRRFDAASRRLPAEERASQREETQQHLEGLAAAKVAQGHSNDAAWESALKQFGDPTQIGRKMYREWQQGKTGFRSDMAAILFGFGLYVVSRFVLQLLVVFWFSRLNDPNDRLYTHGQGVVGPAFVAEMVFAFGFAVLINIPIGRKYPLQAIRGAFYSNVVWDLWSWGVVAVVASVQHANHIPHPWSASPTYAMLLVPLWVAGHVTIAYLASVTKRGWYRPSVADFKLTLPRDRKKQVIG